MRCKECNKKMFSVMEFEKGKMSRFYICQKCKYETPRTKLTEKDLVFQRIL